MTTIVEDCPRCNVKRMTFDVIGDVYVREQYGWMSHHEAAIICRRCKLISVLKICLSEVGLKGKFLERHSLMKINGDLEPNFRPNGFVNVADLAGVAESPKDVPENIQGAFREGAVALRVGCFNAAGTMFRLCVDLATKSKLPGDDSGAEISKHERRNLAPRLDWMFKHGVLPTDLEPLAGVIKDDGNESAHDGTIGREEAEDLLDFATALLERIYTEPARVEAANARRVARRAQAAAAPAAKAR